MSILYRYTVGDLALCKIYVSVLLECFERISVNFMDNKSLQSCFFFFFNQHLLRLRINFKIQRKERRNLKCL